ncbi:MAG: ATP-binding protein [Deltaproteobacteria bacterium]|nr:ATP-binding protein [Deltaproteobacteria bacterium]
MTLYSKKFDVHGMDFIHAGKASVQIKNILKEVGVDQDVIRRAAIATYEAEMNVVMYGQGGQMILELDGEKVCIRAEDQGPGIPDIELALEEGFSTATEEMREMGFGAGMGLPNIKRNADELNIDSAVGQGTRIRMTFLPARQEQTS